MDNRTLIEQITWAIVEVGVAKAAKPDLARVEEVLIISLSHAIMAYEQEQRLKSALVRTATVVDQPLA